MYTICTLERLSVVWAGTLYQDKVTQEEDFGVGTTKLVDPANPKNVFFAGKYQLVNTKSGGAELKLEGKINLSPGEPSVESQGVATRLKCVDLSN